jgi:preprotein translocase subunit SecE
VRLNKERVRNMTKKPSYIKTSYDELVNKVSWPTWSDLQSSTIVVAVASAIIALIIYFMDSVFSNILELFYSFFG